MHANETNGVTVMPFMGGNFPFSLELYEPEKNLGEHMQNTDKVVLGRGQRGRSWGCESERLCPYLLSVHCLSRFRIPIPIHLMWTEAEIEKQRDVN